MCVLSFKTDYSLDEICKMRKSQKISKIQKVFESFISNMVAVLIVALAGCLIISDLIGCICNVKVLDVENLPEIVSFFIALLGLFITVFGTMIPPIKKWLKALDTKTKICLVFIAFYVALILTLLFLKIDLSILRWANCISFACVIIPLYVGIFNKGKNTRSRCDLKKPTYSAKIVVRRRWRTKGQCCCKANIQSASIRHKTRCLHRTR